MLADGERPKGAVVLCPFNESGERERDERTKDGNQMPIAGIGVLVGSSTNLVRSVALAGIQIHVGMDSLISRNHGMIHVALQCRVWWDR